MDISILFLLSVVTISIADQQLQQLSHPAQENIKYEPKNLTDIEKRKYQELVLLRIYFEFLRGTLYICATAKSEFFPVFTPFESNFYEFKKNNGYDEVYPQIFLGDRATAINKTYLESINITHLVNAAEGGSVSTDVNYYKDTELKYLGFVLRDDSNFNISQFFQSAADFIDDAVSSGGRVFVHCKKGVSRSSTLVIAYLMIKKNMTAHDALCQVKRARLVRPNEGFLSQLVKLDLQLRWQELKKLYNLV